jgi:molybdopterin synthase catalytic subunit
MFDLTEEPLDPNTVMEQVRHPGSGAVVVFLGVVRDEDQGRRVRYLEYDAYRSMADKEMGRVGEEVLARWPAARIAMRHRFGRLPVGETALVVAVSAPHRGDAFDACRYAIDRIKEIVPIWKKEVWDDGEAWLEGHAVRD